MYRYESSVTLVETTRPRVILLAGLVYIVDTTGPTKQQTKHLVKQYIIR